MAEKPTYIVSDIHLGAVPRETERAFREFLAHVGEHAAGLLINGDLFDFWFEYRSVIASEHYRVLAALRDVVEAGVPVWFVGGNHDAWGGSFLRDEVGIRLLDGPVELELAGRRCLVVHGDGVGTGDLRYRALRRVLRSSLAIAGFRAIHPDWGARIAARVSTTPEKVGSPGRASAERADRLIAWSRERLAESTRLDMVVAAHVHLPRVHEVEPGRWYVNAGDWINHWSYVVLPPGGAPELRTWPGG
jgi:UDP-2,3-diacylglucosamine hydrolase